jgi:hypothetical protein
MTENVANNIAQGNSQDLTEKWRKGELDGAYYIKNSVDEYEVRIFYDKKKDYRFIGSSIKEFICKVPSYEEWKQLHKFLEEFNALDVAEDNKKLKELLKQWMHFYPIILYEHEDTLKTKDIIELFDKTREVLK